MQIIPAALMVTGAIGSTLSGISQANAQAKAARAEANSIAQQGAFEEQQYRRQALMAIGKQVATTGAAGMDLTSGSPLFAELDSAKQAELNALNIRQRTKYGVASKQYEAKLATSRIPGIILGGVSSLGAGLSVGGSNSILSQWMGGGGSGASNLSWSAAPKGPWR